MSWRTLSSKACCSYIWKGLFGELTGFHITGCVFWFLYRLPHKGYLCFMHILAESAMFSISRNKGKKKRNCWLSWWLKMKFLRMKVMRCSRPCCVSKQSPCEFSLAKSLPWGSLYTYFSGLANFAMLFGICRGIWVARNCRSLEERCLEFLFTVTSLLIASLLTLHTQIQNYSWKFDHIR